MAEPRLFLQNRTLAQTAGRVVLICSLLLNVYFLFIHDRLEPEQQTPGPVVVQGVTITEGNPEDAAQEEAQDQAKEEAKAVRTGASNTVADTAGQVLDPESGVRFLDLRVERNVAYTFNDTLGSDIGDLVSAFFSRVFMWNLDLRSDIRKGDRIKLAYRVITDDRTVDIRAATYKSLKHRQTFEAYWFKPAAWRYGAFFDQNGVELALTLENSPIQQYEQITSLLNDRLRHHGIDFKAPIGTPVTSPYKGKVTRINWRSINGNCIEIKYAESGLLARFLHLSRVEAGIRPGKSVAAGAKIAESGNTGRSTAPHLHYELARPNGRIVDPLSFHKTFHRSVPPASMPEFERMRDHWQELFKKRS